MFAKVFINYMFEICIMVGPEAATFISNDDKACVALSLAATSLQAPVLMHLDYRVRLPDHSFVIGECHTLITPVYGLCEISPKSTINYLRDTFIQIRSYKHNFLTAYIHAHDMRELFNCNQIIIKKKSLSWRLNGAADEAL